MKFSGDFPPVSNLEASCQNKRAVHCQLYYYSQCTGNAVTLIIADFHLCPFRHATVASISSMSPWRQFLPSTAEMDAMLPAPKASALPGNSTSRAMAISRTWFVESPIFATAYDGETEGGIEGREVEEVEQLPWQRLGQFIASVSAAEAIVARGRNDVKTVVRTLRPSASLTQP
jgi:hypothetical protein